MQIDFCMLNSLLQKKLTFFELVLVLQPHINLFSHFEIFHCRKTTQEKSTKMMNYRKGRNVEEELTRNDIQIDNLPEDFLWMHVSIFGF